MTHTFRTPAAILGLALALTVSLTACGDSDSPAPGPAPAGAGGSSSDSAGAAVTLPADFPSEVPIIDGTILHAGHPGKIWGVWVASSDLPGDMAKATQLLVDAGYENVIVTDEYRDFHGTAYQVHVTAKDDPKYGSSIAYAFYHVQ